MIDPQPTTITQKGQVTIPVEIRKLLKLRSGDQVKFMVDKKSGVNIKLAKRSSIMNLYGSLKPKIKYQASDDIYKIIKGEEEAWPKAAIERDQKSIRQSKNQK